MFSKNQRKKALEALKQHAQNLRRLPRTQQLSPWPQAEDLVYGINPVYLEISQGGTSPMRGWGALIFLGMLATSLWAPFEMYFLVFDYWERGFYSDSFFDGLSAVGLLSLSTLLLFLSIIPLFWLYMSFFAVTDVVVRFDRKRGKVWMWTGGGPIEMRWADLQPAVMGLAASAHLPSRTYRGVYAEFDADGQIRTTHNIPHLIQVGQISAAEPGVMPALEYVREFMERGPGVLPPPNRLLQHRPRWYAMVNFLGLADEWALIAAGKPAPLGKPWVRTIGFVLFFPLLFPLQFTNWLALRVAPIPKWPKKIADMHAADLADSDRPKRKPVIRINGELVDPEP